MKHGSTTSLWSQIDSQLSGQQHVKAVQSNQRHKHQQARFWPPQGIFFINCLEKGRTINSEYHIALLVCLKEEIIKNSHKWRRKKCSFTKTIHRVTSQSQQWQKYMNCFCTHSILQIWLPVTTECLQTSKECSRERDLAPIKKWYPYLPTPPLG